MIMGFIVITISNLIWIFYCLTEGVREGFFNHYRSSYRNHLGYNFKKMFMIQRLLVLFATGGIMLYTIGLIAIPFIIGQIFMFHFLHKMAYNCTVSKIEKIKQDPETAVPDRIKEPMVILGVTLQIFFYLFLM